MRITIIGSGGQASGDVQLDDVLWTATASRTFGELTATIGPSSAFWQHPALLDDGGFLVYLNHPTLGDWIGIADAPDYHRSLQQCQLKALEWQAITSNFIIGWGRSFRSLPAGAIAKACCRAALAGKAYASLADSTFAEAAPVVDLDFSGQYLSDALNDLALRSGQEWQFSPEGQFTWGPPRGKVYTKVIAEGVELVDVSRSANPMSRLSSVIARGSDGREFVARAEIAGGDIWQRAQVVSVSSSNPITLGRAALRTLAANRATTVTYTMRASSSHFAVREGDWLRCILTSVGRDGECPLVRVVNRSWRDGQDFVNLTVQRVDEITESNIVSYGREVPGGGITVDYQLDAVRRLADFVRTGS